MPDDPPAPPAAFEVHLGLTDHEAVLAVVGELDLLSATMLEPLVEQAVETRPRIVFDLGETTFIDSSGLAVILRAVQATGQIPEAVVVRSARPAARTLFRVTGCERLVTFEPDVRHAPSGASRWSGAG